jgi:Flp pilus assembly protein TadG
VNQANQGVKIVKKLHSERGAAAVEFALLLPLLVALLLGILEFGLSFSAQLTVSNAAREAARTMVITDAATNTAAQVRAAARADARAAAAVLDPALADADIQFAPAACAQGVMSTTTITYRHAFLTGFFGANVTLTGRAAMRCEG